MEHEVIEAVDRLRRDGALNEARAAFFLRIARRELVSVRLELSLLIYAGVLLVAAGAGILVKENYRNIGPLVISLGLALGAGLCLWYVARRASAFTWKAVPSPTLAFDYLLLLGVILLGADLAYLETQFRMLGPGWPWHLLIVSLVYGWFAYRYDSRAVLSLALTTFAAWRGVAVSFRGLDRLGGYHADSYRLNAIVCAVLFLGGATFSRLAKRKAHFEPVWGNLGLMLLFGALLSGVYGQEGLISLWAAALFAAAALTVWIAYGMKESSYFALGVLAAYLGLLRFVFEVLHGASGAFFTAFTSLGVILFLVLTHRRMRGEP